MATIDPKRVLQDAKAQLVDKFVSRAEEASHDAELVEENILANIPKPEPTGNEEADNVALANWERSVEMIEALQTRKSNLAERNQSRADAYTEVLTTYAKAKGIPFEAAEAE